MMYNATRKINVALDSLLAPEFRKGWNMYKNVIRGALLIAVCLSISLLHPKPAAAAVANWQKSVMIQSQSPTDFASSSFDQSVNNAVADGANYITLVIQLDQSSISSTDIAPGANNPTDQTLTTAINYIHSKGAKVALTIHDDSYDGQWRAFINPSNRTAWFANYGSYLDHYATLGQSTGVDEIVLGTEMTSMTSPSYNSTNTANWITMVQSVRANYKGLLTYSAQHEGYMSDLESVGFWQDLDFIGVSAYYGLGTDTSVSAITAQWNTINTDYLEPLEAKYNKPILFTEVGYASKVNTLSDPGSAYSASGGVDLTMQANAYQALFNYWNNYSYMAGAMLWDWSSNPNAGGSNDTDYTPQNKPAEQVMKQAFAMTSGSSSSTPVTQKYAATVSTTTSALTVGSPVNLTTSATAAAGASNALVDVEVYSASGQQVFQQAFQNQNLSATATSLLSNWTPTAAGSYTVKVGIFSANWQSNLLWNDSALTLNVTAPQTSPVATASTIDIWWPGTGTVYGSQPFKALIDGRDVNSYTMYWQVGNGQLNLMANNTNPINHKESEVDLSGWDWNANDQYVVTFVAKDLSGNIIATRSQTITVGH